MANELAKRYTRVPETISLYEAVLRDEPQHVNAYFNLAVVLANHGQLEPAIAHFRRVLQLDPMRLDAQENLKLLEARK